MGIVASMADYPKTIPELQKALTDAALIGIGFGVIAYNKAQVRRRELAADVEKQTSVLREQAEKFIADRAEAAAVLAKRFEDRLEPVQKAVDEALDQVEERLPEPAAQAVKTARAAAKDASDQLRARLVNPTTARTSTAA